MSFFYILISIFMTILLNRSFSYAISLDDLPNDSGNGAKIIIVFIFFLIIYHNEVKKYILPSKNDIIINNDIDIVVDKNLLDIELISKEEIDLNINMFLDILSKFIDIILKLIGTSIIVYFFGVFFFFFSVCGLAIYDFLYPLDLKKVSDNKKISKDKENNNDKNK